MIRKTAPLFLLIVLVSLTAANHNSDSVFSGGQNSPMGFSDYQNNEEILTQLVAPFILVAVTIQIGLKRALMFTLADDRDHWYGSDPEYKSEKKRVNKQSMVLSLVITGMLVPTAFFQQINTAVAWAFGGGIYALIGIASIYFLYRLIESFF